MTKNTLYFGDNLDVLKQHVKDESVDLIYLDPPFNSRRTYNLLFQEHDGSCSEAQNHAFQDTWKWEAETPAEFQELMRGGGEIARVMECFRTVLRETSLLAYLTRMAPRLGQLHRVLKATGSIYLHCDPTASHHLKLLMDVIFGSQNFVNEIVWKRSSAHNDTKQGAQHFGRVTDTLLFYSKSDKRTWNQLHAPYDEKYIERDYRRFDPDGRRYRIDNLQGPGGAAKGNPYYEVMGVKRYWRYKKEKMEELIKQGRVIQTKPGAVPQFKRYLDEMPGMPVQNLWTDIPVINNRSDEKLGWPTQKPEALLERIIKASSNEGDLVLDPFCGCGTAVSVAQRLNRRWTGIDITHLAVNVMKHRLHRDHGLDLGSDYEVKGEPGVLSEAQVLASSDPYHFEHWALGLVNARASAKGKGADGGLDGWLGFYTAPGSLEQGRIIVSVKAGKNVGVDMVRELGYVVDRDKAAIGVLILMAQPTKPMKAEASQAGFYACTGWDSKHRKLQILTVEELLVQGKKIDCPPTKPQGKSEAA